MGDGTISSDFSWSAKPFIVRGLLLISTATRADWTELEPGPTSTDLVQRPPGTESNCATVWIQVFPVCRALPGPAAA
eukprot:6475408-Pyramimonas_sp.AAC.1